MLIRKSMLKLLLDGIEVPDAVYSKMNIDTKIIEDTILEKRGLIIIIDN